MSPSAVQSPSSAPIIVTALLGPEDFAWADALRRAHFPPERNQLRAHLTLFHHLPPGIARELTQVLKDETKAPPPAAQLAGVMSLGRGVAFRVESSELGLVRARLADRFAPLLLPQDKQGWRAHITVQNKVEPREAKALLAELAAGFRPRPLVIAGLAAWWYRGGPWEQLGAWRFGSGHALTAPT